MTDQNIPADVTDDERRRARECAEFIESDMSAWGDGIRALARVFLNDAPAPTLAAMIAGMREEWGVHVTGYPKNIADWAELCGSPEDHITWLPDEEAAEDFAVEREDDGFDTRIVRRYVTEPEEV